MIFTKIIDEKRGSVGLYRVGVEKYFSIFEIQFSYLKGHVG